VQSLGDKQPARPVVMGVNGAVSAGHSLASLAGITTLMAGGNAFDAAVSVAAALNVVEPHGSGMGGDAFIVAHIGETGETLGVNATGPAPAGATPKAFPEGMPGRGPRSVSVPGAVGGWGVLTERWGRLGLARALEPAIRLAEEGFPVSHHLAGRIVGHQNLLAEYPAASEVFLPGGHPPGPQEILVQRDLGASFRAIAEGGVDAFYRGSVAEAICRAVADAGGLLDRESMEGYQAEVTDVLSIEYRGHTVCTPPPNSTGHVLLQELLMLQEFELSGYAPLSPELIHLMVEIKKLAFADRERYNGDPRFTDPLPGHLLSPEYARERAGLIDPSRCRPVDAVPAHSGSDDTTYFAVADADGNAVSVTTSINAGFGSGFMSPGTGIFLNNRMRYWHLDARHPNALVPGKRVRHTVSPAMVMRDGSPVFVIGTPGADGQVQTIFQVLVNILDYGINHQLAVELPRWRSSSIGQESNYPHGQVDQLDIEDRMPEQVDEYLSARGHAVRRTSQLGTFGSCQLIHIGRSGARLTFGAAADPRRDGYAITW
jgi:gamma-glutamyltranspeptidase